MDIWHITLASDGRDRWFPDTAQRLSATRALARVAGQRTLLFCIVDDHLHLVARCSRPRAGRLAAGIATSLRPHISAPLEAARIRPVESRHHLESLVRYVLLQPEHHNLPEHPATWESGCFPDLTGARHLPGFDPTAWLEALPRWRAGRLWSLIGLQEPYGFRTDEDLRLLGPRRLLDAASAVLCTTRSDRATPGVLARALAAQTAEQAGCTRAELGFGLDAPPSSVRRMLDKPVPDLLFDMLQRRLMLEQALSAGVSAPRRVA